MKQIPNLITCLNMLAGSFACVMALRYNNYVGAFLFIVIAAIFDFFDGTAARLLKAYSKIGAELDSLADVVSFGLAPGCVVYSWLTGFMNEIGLPLAAFLLPIFSALRLAKFNIDTRQTNSFLGLPVPASALFWSSFISSLNHRIISSFSIYVLIGILVLLVSFCILMISEVPMFSLKFKDLRLKNNRRPFALLLIALIVFSVSIFLNVTLFSVSLIILIYIGMSLVRR